MPHTPLMHWLSSAHEVPSVSLAPQVPLAPGLKQLPLAQSPMPVQLVRQSVPEPLHFKLLGHGVGLGEAQAPLPLHLLPGVSWWPLHDLTAPHAVVDGG
jgi:hypothetical protein